MKKVHRRIDTNREDKHIFMALVTNAIDFFDRSIKEFTAHPKYAVVHFCAALETLLKARLMKEHWTLIIAKPDKMKRANFLNGDFPSVGIEEAITRLRNVADCNISKEAEESFKKIIDARNKIVHFFNDDVNKNKLKEEIARNQYAAWYFIEELLKDWRIHFISFKDEIANIRQLMKTHEVYLDERYKQVDRQYLSSARKAGLLITDCPLCKKEAMILGEDPKSIFHGHCKVCEKENTYIGIKCPSCNEIFFYNDTNTLCSCGQSITKDDIISYLRTIYHFHQPICDDEYGNVGISCPNCEGYHTVYNLHGDSWICLECLSIFDRISQCEWCNEFVAGKLNNSYFSGCSHCDGFAGWHADDKD